MAKEEIKKDDKKKNKVTDAIMKYYEIRSLDNQKNTEPQPAPVSEQRALVDGIKNESFKHNGIYCIMNSKWYNDLKRYVKADLTVNKNDNSTEGKPPGTIDNSKLLSNFEEYIENNGKMFAKLKNGLKKKDYSIVPLSYFEKFLKWYGGAHNGYAPTIARVSVGRNFEEYGFYSTIFTFDPDPLKPYEKGEVFQFTNTLTFKDLRKIVFDRMYPDLPDEKRKQVRFWSTIYSSPDRCFTLKEHGKKIIQSIFRKSSTIDLMLEFPMKIEPKEGEDVKTTDVKYHLDAVVKMCEKKKERYSDYHTTSMDPNYYKINQGNNKPSKPGVCGLRNLGNTCFMNSALQCLTKTKAIVEYFCLNNYKKEINVDNPLGMKGEIALSFGKLMQSIYTGKHSVVAPRQFKFTIGKFAPQFSGYNQQDAAELVAYLLDGIHEDLNRIKKKPSTTPVEGNGRSNEIVAKESWETYKKRNDSIIVDKFQGQLRSELTCPKCKNISITFDPFMYLQLPLVGERKRLLEVTLVYPINFDLDCYIKKFKISVNKLSGIENLRESCYNLLTKEEKEKFGVGVHNIVLADIFKERVFKFYDDILPVSKISKNDVTYAYVVPGNPKIIKVEKAEKKSSKKDDGDKKEEEEEQEEKKVEYIERGYHKCYTGVVEYGEFKIRVVDKNGTKESICEPFCFYMKKQGCTQKQVFDNIYKYILNICKKHKNYEKNKKKLLEKFGLNLDDPSTLFSKRPEPRNKENKEGERDAASPPSADAANPQKQEKEEVEPALFFLVWDKKGTYDNVTLYYDDEKVEAKERSAKYASYYSSSSVEHFKFTLFFEESIFKMLFPKLSKKEEKLYKSIFGVFDLDDSFKKKDEKKKEKSVTLDNCIELFSEKEKLGKNDTWYCPKCKEHVQAAKKIDIWKLPEVLVIQMKRFTASGMYREKISTDVKYPHVLDMSKHTINKKNQFLKYNLYGVSMHFGGLGGGHYTAYSKVGDTWYEFDDSSSSKVKNKDSVITQSGYCLFYEAANSEVKIDLKGISKQIVKIKEDEKKKEEEGEKQEENKKDEDGDTLMNIE